MDAAIPVPQFEFLFRVRLNFATRLRFGPNPAGADHGFVAVSGGDIEGPRLNGRVMPDSGGDWATIRPDGVVVLNARYMLEASDGTPIAIHNVGYHVYPSSAMIGRVDEMTAAQRQADYFRLTPTFETKTGPHDWLTRTVVIGFGERRTDPDHSVFHYFAIL